MKKIFFTITTFFIALPVIAAELPNPLGKGKTDLNKIIGSSINSVLGVIGTIALVLFIYGGFRILFSMGKGDKINKGKNTMIWATIGLIIVFASYALAKFTLNVISLQ